jgi:transposase
LSADQLQLALEDLEQTAAANEAAQDAAENKQRQRRETRPNRNHGALPAHLPRYEVLIDVEQRDCPCCGGAMHTIGELRSEQLDIVPAQLRVRVTPVRAMPVGSAKALSWSPRRRSGRSTAAWPPRHW